MEERHIKDRIVTWFKNADKKKLAIAGSVAAIVIIAVIVLVVVFCVKGNDNGEVSKGQSFGNEETDESSNNSDGKSSNDENSDSESTGENEEGESQTDSNGNENGSTENGDNSSSSGNVSSEITDTPDSNDVKENQADNSLGSGASVNVGSMEKTAKSIGIDVARYQGMIDWSAVAADGIDFAMIRVGYRSTVSGEINEDPYAAYNITNALANNINVGIYFFSSAVTEEEAVQEANWTADFIAKYSITYPVAYNCEGFSDSDSRQYSLTKAERSALAVKFLDTISGRGYTPMFYASKYEMENNEMWDMTTIGSKFKVWVAWYPDNPYPKTANPNYSGNYHMWQYTSNGTVSGINGAVDINVSYMDISSSGGNSTGTGGESTTLENVTVSPEANMNFKEVNETVTAKIEVNLRDTPSQDSSSKVLYTLKNGETAVRTAVSDTGWSRLVYNGQICYAVSSYLTTDLSQNVETTAKEEETTLRNQFTEVNDIVTAKEEVNLRTLPSATDSEVVYTLKNGENVQRTGTSDLGWSRVIYNGQILYCITTYLQVVE